MSDLEKRITAKMILDDSGYSNTLRGINSELKNNQSELKVARSGLEAFGQTTENVARVQTSLQKQLDLQNKKLDTYKSSIEKATNTLDQNIVKRDELTRSLAKAEKAHESAKSILNHSYSKSIIDMAEKEYEEDFQKIIDGETTFEEVEAKLLKKWDKKVALQRRIVKLEEEFKEANDIINDWNNKNNPLYERHKNCTEGLASRIDKIKKELLEMT